MKGPRFKISVTQAERDTILAALAAWRDVGCRSADPVINDIAADNGQPLSVEEVQQLAERINN